MTSAHFVVDTLAQAATALFQQTADVVLLVDAEGLLLTASTPAQHALGPAATVAGADARRLLGVAAGAAMDGPVHLPDGRHAELSATAISDEHGQALLTLVRVAVTAPEEGRADALLEQRLREATLAISSAIDVGEIMRRVVGLSVELLGADAGSLPLYDAQRDRLMPAYKLNLHFSARVLERGEGTVWQVIDTGRPLLNNSYASDPCGLCEVQALGVVATLCVPVRAGPQLLGVLIVYSTRPERLFTTRDQELLTTVGQQAGAALQNARLYAAAVREAERRAVIHRASLAFGAALTTGELYAAIHRAVLSLMPCDACAIALFDAARNELDYVYLAEGERLWPRVRGPASRGLLGYIVRTGISLRFDNCDDEDDELFEAEPYGDSTEPTRALIAVALTVADQTIGAITVQASWPGAYRSSDLDALETLAITAAIAIQNAQLFSQVHELATRDALTGVFNRRHFYELARRELERSERYAHSVSLLMLDVDQFKQINDTYGHLAGDQVLQAIAARCQQSMRTVDVVARFGGEEFLVLLPETGPDEALQAAQRLHERIGGDPVLTDAGPVSVTVSIGVASANHNALGTLDQLVARVDRALYEAKRGGRDQVADG